MTLASVLIGKAANVLNDTGATRWTSAELLDWLNEAQRTIATLVVEASSKVADFAMVAGTRQTMPADSIALIDVVRNTGASGSTPGEAPRRTTQSLMNLQRPTWHADTAASAIKNWMYDPKQPTIFYVWPPVVGTPHIDIAYTAVPATVASSGSAITLADEYQTPILDYMLYMAFSKDTEIASMQARAAAHKAAFDAAVAGTDRTTQQAAA